MAQPYLDCVSNSKIAMFVWTGGYDLATKYLVIVWSSLAVTFMCGWAEVVTLLCVSAGVRGHSGQYGG